MKNPGFLHLANHTVLPGLLPNWHVDDISGEVVFTTGMTGYYESLTDPSYCGQILVFTYPLIGNYGVPDHSHWESHRIHARGAIISEACLHWSHAKGIQALEEWLTEQRVPLMTGVDTRQLTKILRESGVMLGTISSHAGKPVALNPSTSLSSVVQVSSKQRETYGSGRKKIVLVDCGMKTNILRCLQKHSVTIERVPYDYDYSQDDFDGVFLSNGPGDPQECSATIHILKRAMARNKPIYGICLGAQLLALAAGGSTYKLRYGHRGHNQPCMDLRTERCYITSQNHGYAVNESSLPSDWMVTFRNLNDNSVEGISHREKPFHAVQFHPEAAPGPNDCQWFFEQFFACL
jgi:carbamoyl-phosphate synthase small subunit